MKYIIGNENKARFWHEVWLGDCPLNIRFSKLYIICDQQAWEVSRVLREGEINLTFRRNFDISEVLEWEELEGVQLTYEENSVRLDAHPSWRVYNYIIIQVLHLSRGEGSKDGRNVAIKVASEGDFFVWLVI
jgi:hypothetical protein